MSLLPPTTCEEGVKQYCGYGYDKNLYSSYDDCINKKMKECPPLNNTSGYYNSQATITCNDGTQEYPFPGTPSFQPIPCENHGGVKIDSGGGIPDEEKAITEKSDCNEIIDFRWHCWRKDAQIAISIGVLAFAGYGVYKKKTPLAIAGLGLLGGLSGMILLSMKPKN